LPERADAKGRQSELNSNEKNTKGTARQRTIESHIFSTYKKVRKKGVEIKWSENHNLPSFWRDKETEERHRGRKGGMHRHSKRRDDAERGETVGWPATKLKGWEKVRENPDRGVFRLKNP